MNLPGIDIAGKVAVLYLTKSLAQELVKENVQVNSIAPSYIVTPMTSDWIDLKRDEIIRKIPMGRLATGDDLAGAVIYYSSEASNFITGQTIFIDGGSAL